MHLSAVLSNLTLLAERNERILSLSSFVSLRSPDLWWISAINGKSLAFYGVGSST